MTNSSLLSPSPSRTPNRSSVVRMYAAACQAELAKRGIEASRYDWEKLARPNQLPPLGDWRGWLLLAGRGFGKTRTGAEWVRAQIKSGKRRIALVAPTAADARDVMVEGASGILSVFRLENDQSIDRQSAA